MEGSGVEGLGTEVGPTATLVGRPTPYLAPPPLAQSSFLSFPQECPRRKVGRATGATFFPAQSAGGLCLKEKRPWAHTAQSLELRTYGEEEGELSLSGGSCELSLERR